MNKISSKYIGLLVVIAFAVKDLVIFFIKQKTEITLKSILFEKVEILLEAKALTGSSVVTM